MNDTLITQLLDFGLLQFGSFRVDDIKIPFALHLEMLPSYPASMREASERIAQLLADSERVDRLLCAPDAIGLGAMVSTQLNKPLIYDDSKGTLVGAYDIGHPTALIVNDTGDLSAARELIRSALRVGLDVTEVVALVGVGKTRSIDAIINREVLALADLVDAAESERRIPPGQAARVRRWFIEQG